MKRFLTLICLILTAAVACTKESDTYTYPELPDAYRELFDSYSEGKVIDLIGQRFGIYTISFTDNTRISVSTLDLPINDCSIYEPKRLTVSGGYWKIGDRMSEIRFDESLADSDAFPVYIYFDDLTLYIHLNNSHVISFRSLALEKYEENKRDEAELERLKNLPVIHIDTGGAPILDKKNYVDGTITISDPEKIYSIISTFTSDMGIRGRGNSTWGFPKKPWKVKLDKAASLLGMPSDKEWALLANYTDRTLMRNVVAMKLSEMCGFSWTPRMRHVEVYLNGEYQGVYTLCEHKKVSPDRINIDVVDEGDDDGEAVTGAYYIEIEAALDEPVNWRTEMGVPLMFSDPEYPSAAQEAYVKKFFRDFEASLYSEDLADLEKGYQAYIDVDSFIDYYIVQELTKNIDGNLFKSAFVTKERGKKLEMYHLWDFDLTLGNCGYHHSSIGSGPENFWIRDVNSYSQPGDNWFNRMMNDPAFVQRLKDRWNELKPSFETIPVFIDEQAMILEKAQYANFEVWGINASIDWVKMPSLGSYQKEVEYLRKFYTARLNWLHTAINAM